ncbi:hypothetical protein BGZ75_008440 [Mortierella antarctica]|nr:hypothetical protein BGZ75_008440 [Mortierella antarctica]
MDTDSKLLYQIVDSSKGDSSESIAISARRETERARMLPDAEYREKLQEIVSALKILLDPWKRRVYDVYGMAGIQMAETKFGANYLKWHMGIHEHSTTAILWMITLVQWTKMLDDFKPAWAWWSPIWNIVGLDLFMILSTLFRYPFCEDIGMPFDLAPPGLQGSRRVNTIFSLVNATLFIAFQSLIILKIDEPSSIATAVVFVPFFLLLANLSVQGIVRLTPRLTQAEGSPVTQALLVYDSLSWKIAYLALVVLIILRVDGFITCSWHVVFIPLYAVGQKYPLMIISDSMSLFKILDAQKRRQGAWLLLISIVTCVVISSICYAGVAILAIKLDGGIANTIPLSPVAWVAYGIFAVDLMGMPLYLIHKKKAEEALTTAPAPGPIRTISSTSYTVSAGGKGANQSVALGRAGANVYHAGKIGKDGEWVRKIMEDAGVDTSYIKVAPKEATGRAIIQLSQESHDNSIVLFPGTNNTVAIEEARHVLKHFGKGDWIIMQNEISSGGEIMRAAKERGMTICFNPSPMTAELPKEYPLHLVDYLLINEIEAQGLYSFLTAPKSDSESISSASHITASESFPVLEKAYERISGIIITLGGDGLVARFRINAEDTNMKEFRMGIVKGEVVNTTGAGDTFSGYFVANLVRNQEQNKRFSEEQLKAALEEASQAASLAVSKEGAMDSIPMKEEVEQAMSQK